MKNEGRIHYGPILDEYIEAILAFLCSMELSEKEKGIIQEFFSSRPIKRAFLFGSYARKDAVKRISDVDILVELDHSHPIGMKFFSYKSELEELLKKKIDLISIEGLSDRVRPYVDHDKILIYERVTETVSPFFLF